MELLPTPDQRMLCIYIYIPTPLNKEDVKYEQFFKHSLTDLKSEFSFSLTGCHTKVKEPSFTYCLPQNFSIEKIYKNFTSQKSLTQKYKYI